MQAQNQKHGNASVTGGLTSRIRRGGLLTGRCKPKLRRRRFGLVAALICILGTAVMLFNWIVVNFLLSGKHSYA
jgi:hypothetical protein